MASSFELLKAEQLLELNAVREDIAALNEAARLRNEQKDRRKSEISAVLAARNETLSKLQEELLSAKDKATKDGGDLEAEKYPTNGSTNETQIVDNPANTH